LGGLAQPPLKPLHAKTTLNQGKIAFFSRRSDAELVEWLKSGRPGSLKTRPDGPVIDGHHRIKVLKDRGIDVDSLPREIIPKEDTSTS
jgi:hypothetical protein